jgi:pimeloyl-ACP methyl ester carboxylesterase
LDSPRLRVCLDRVVELAAARLRLRDWPGVAGPLVHVPDPISPAAHPAAPAFALAAESSTLASPAADLAAALAAAFAPRYRVLSLALRPNQPYQVHAADLLAVLDQFGFDSPILIGEGLGCVAALLVAAWHPKRVGRLALIQPTYAAKPAPTASPAPHAQTMPAVPAAPAARSVLVRSLHDCPPDWLTLRQAVDCPVLDLPWSANAIPELEAVLDA